MRTAHEYNAVNEIQREVNKPLFISKQKLYPIFKLLRRVKDLCTRQFFASQDERAKDESIRPTKAIAEGSIAEEEDRFSEGAADLRGKKLSCTEVKDMELPG